MTPIKSDIVPVDEKNEQPAQLARALLVRRFVTELIRLNFRAAPAFRAVRGDVSKKSSRQLASQLLQAQDVRDELHRQLSSIAKDADLDESWVKQYYRAIAEVSALDVVKIDKSGNVVEFTLDQLTQLQRRCVRGLRFSAQTGKVIGFDLPSLKETIDSVAKLNKLFSTLEDEVAGKQFADEITRRMQHASRRVPPALLDHSDEDEIE